MKLSDFKGVFRKSTVTVEAIDNPFGDYYTVRLKPEPGTEWAPGEHAVFTMPDKEIEGKQRRAFSIASIPDEGNILLGMRTGKEVSSFKKHLLNSSPGEKVTMRGPFGWFKLKKDTAAIVLIAAGVGITPIRALLKALENDKSKLVTVIYASGDEYLFEEELAAMAKKNTRLTVFKTETPGETMTRVQKLTEIHQNKAWYYVSGSQHFIADVKEQIVGGGVKKRRVINDPFLGY